MIYFHIHDARWFHDDFVPALTNCRQRRSFVPCQKLCHYLSTTARDYCERFHVGEQPLITRIDGLPYAPDLWRLLVGELLVFGALDLPEFEQAPELLCRLAGAELGEHPLRAQFGSMRQAHYGARDLSFGAAVYRPQTVGWNDAEDMARIADYLNSLAVESWSASMLKAPATAVEDADLEQELVYAQDCLPDLKRIYREAAIAGHLIVAEVA